MIWGERTVPAGYVHNLIVARPFGGQGWAFGFSSGLRTTWPSLDGACEARLWRSESRLRNLYESVGYHWVKDQQYAWLDSELALRSTRRFCATISLVDSDETSPKPGELHSRAGHGEPRLARNGDAARSAGRERLRPEQ